jgi:hypothetical protein
MAHRLCPALEGEPLEPGEVVRRLSRGFAAVYEDWDAGAKHIDQMVAQLQRMNAPSEVIEAYRQKRNETVHLIVTDDPTSEVAYLSFAAMPGEGLLIGYHSGQHEDAARPSLKKCARALGYLIHLV